MHDLSFSWCVETSKFSKFLAELLAAQIFFNVPEHNQKNNKPVYVAFLIYYFMCLNAHYIRYGYECGFGRRTKSIN